VWRNFRLGFFVASLALAGCGNGSTADEAGAVGSAENIGVAQTATIDSIGKVEVVEQSAKVSETKPTPTSAGSDADDLTAYVGKFPFDKIGGVTWGDHPLVKDGIRKTVKDAAVRTAMDMPGGPSAPIGMHNGKVGSWACEAHNCGDHQWAVLVDPKSGATDVCYHNAAKTGDKSRWFLANGTEEVRSGNCTVV
jgi:hypothetical protein